MGVKLQEKKKISCTREWKTEATQAIGTHKEFSETQRISKDR